MTSWWLTAPRSGFTADAAKRFDGCSFSSHKKPRVYESTEDATMSRAPSSHSRYDAVLELTDDTGDRKDYN
jgi:hypothetical protein